LEEAGVPLPSSFLVSKNGRQRIFERFRIEIGHRPKPSSFIHPPMMPRFKSFSGNGCEKWVVCCAKTIRFAMKTCFSQPPLSYNILKSRDCSCDFLNSEEEIP